MKSIIDVENGSLEIRTEITADSHLENDRVAWIILPNSSPRRVIVGREE